MFQLIKAKDAYNNKLGHHWFRWHLITSMAPDHYLNQYWHCVNWTLGTNFCKIWINHFCSRKSIWKCHLQNGGHDLNESNYGISVATPIPLNQGIPHQRSRSQEGSTKTNICLNQALWGHYHLKVKILLSERPGRLFCGPQDVQQEWNINSLGPVNAVVVSN